MAVNAASTHSQGFVRLPFGDLAGRQWRLEDLLGDAVYVRDGGELQTWGLFLDEPPWKAQVFALMCSRMSACAGEVSSAARCA